MSKSPFNGIWNKLDNFRPGLVRLLATDKAHGRPRALTDEEIASNCDLSISDIQRIQWEKSWDDVTYGEMREFFRGCGFDLNNRRDVAFITGKLQGERGYKWKHLQRSPHHKFFHKLLKHNAE